MRDVLLAGIYDADIRREMYGIDQILQQPVNDVIAMVEKKEMARDAHSAASQSAMSSMKKQKKKNEKQKLTDTDKSKQATCPQCKKMYALHREGRFGWNSKPFDMCIDCFRIKGRKKQGDNSAASISDSENTADIGIIVAHVSSIAASGSECTSPITPRTSGNEALGDQKQSKVSLNSTKSTTKKNISMDHHIFTEGEWRRSKFLDHPP